MLAAVPRLLLCFCFALTLTACDRTELDDDDDPPPGGGGGMVDDGTCSASVGGNRFEAFMPSATTNDQGDVLSIACREFNDGLLFELRPAGFGEAMLGLGPGSANQAQYSDRGEVSNTAELAGGAFGGSVTLQAFDQNRVQGTFTVNAPGFDDGDPVINIVNGRFDLPVRLSVGDGS
ncbi:MAG: DUF6252 family protein [Bacteroidota bacterium]